MIPYLLNMIIAIILGGILMGWFVGNLLLDKWLNEGVEESNNDEKKNHNHGKSKKGTSKAKEQKIS